MKETVKKLGNIIFYTLASFLLSFILLELLFPSKTMDILGFKGFVVVSDSMEPIIDVYDIVIVTPIEDGDLEVGQIITFYAYLPTVNEDVDGNTIYSKQPVTHYLAEINEVNGNITIETHAYGKEDDFDNWTDESGNPIYLTSDDLIGKVSFTIPFIGIIITFLMTLVSNPILLGLVVLNLVIIYLLIKYIKKTKVKSHDVG